MEISNFIKQDIKIHHNNFIIGNRDSIKGSQLDLKTLITLALPSDQGYFKEGNFELDYNGKTIKIQIFKILNKTQDPFFSIISNFNKIETFYENISNIHIPIEMYTDNRGNYPYYCAKISFSYRLEGWVNRNSDYDREQITGYKDENKIEALLVLNKLFQSRCHIPNRSLVYEDVILFVEDYLLKQNSQTLVQRIVTFASENAFTDAIYSFLGFNGNNYIAEIIEKQSHLSTYPDIQTENDLLEFIIHSIENNIIHYIENQYIIQAFWNDSDEEPNHHKPKKEVDIQSILYLILQVSLLEPSGIKIVKEPDKGVGKPDFVFGYRTSAGKDLNIPFEFKLAHNQRIEHGIKRQLPAYMKADKTTCGIYAVMWFKDEEEKIFKEPKKRTKTGMAEYIREKAKEINEKEGLNIRTLFIDASVRKSASRL